METLKDKTAKGLLWGGVSNGIQQLLNLAFGIFLARLLTQADYGMVGLLTVFSSTSFWVRAPTISVPSSTRLMVPCFSSPAA